MTLIRRFIAADAVAIGSIFYRSVHDVGRAKYDRAQLDAWAPSIPDPADWIDRLMAFDTSVVRNDGGEAVGSIAMTVAGYIDIFLSLPTATRSDVADQLYRTVEAIAIACGIAAMSAHASLFAESFLRRRG